MKKLTTTLCLSLIVLLGSIENSASIGRYMNCEEEAEDGKEVAGECHD